MPPNRQAGRKLGRTAEHRRAMLRNLAVALIVQERVTTTEAKAKEIRRFVEPLITRAKTAQDATAEPAKPSKEDAKSKKVAVPVNVPVVRQLTAALPNQRAVRKLVTDLGPKYRERPGGYLRLTKLRARSGDAAREVRVELV